ncbi:hypothetical protein F2Q70_00018399 [Brassica cretica]|uniref:Vesicle tethering protein Uso1/P115-like head domain-containing protein n=1 Tax=Brassica cretica TaxID=69181 RepID=A0A8S9HVP1_BRACR|nr:hypothetical protein F2Q70_00018399 [Brassica cretica]
MDLASRYKGVVGLVFGDNPSSNEDSYIQRLLDRISNGTLPDDRRSAIVELQSVVAESNAAQLAFGASGFPVVVGILKDQRDDVEMGVVGLVFGDNPSSNEDSYIQRLLDRISNGTLPDDRRSAIVELQSVVAESNAAQLAFGAASGLPVVVGILKDQRDDVEMTFKCIGDLVDGHPKNRDILASKVLGEDRQAEPALNSILRIILQTSSIQEFVAADYVFKTFCEKNREGQAMLASTLIPQPHPTTRDPLEDDVNMSFGSMLLRGICSGETDGNLETCCRAASILSHVLKDNVQCKEKALKIVLESPVPSMGTPEPLFQRIVRYLAVASSMKSKDKSKSYIQQIILKLLVTWTVDCPAAVQCFLDSRHHLTYLLDLVANPAATVCIRGLASILLGECVIYNKSNENGKDAFAVVDAVSQKMGLTTYFSKFEEMQSSFVFSSSSEGPREDHEPLTRTATPSEAEIEDVDVAGVMDKGNEDHPMLISLFDPSFTGLVKSLEGSIRERIVDVYSRPKSEVAVVPADLEQRSGESEKDYINRLKAFIEKQCSEIQVHASCSTRLCF